MNIKLDSLKLENKNETININSNRHGWILNAHIYSGSKVDLYELDNRNKTISINIGSITIFLNEPEQWNELKSKLDKIIEDKMIGNNKVVNKQ